MDAGLRGDFTGHRRFLAMSPRPCAVVVVTYNRADLLVRMLDGLAAPDPPPDAVIVVDNASTDHTRDVLLPPTTSRSQVTHLADNLGGAGGFHLGRQAGLRRRASTGSG